MRASIVEGIRLHPLWTFFGLTFVLSWALWSALFGIAPVNADAAAANPAIFFAILWGGPLVGPALAALLVTAVTAGKAGVGELANRLTRWRVGIRWYAVALLATLLVAAATLAVLAVTVSPRFVPRLPQDWTMILLVSIAGGVSSLLEELGWTGFALPRLLAGRRALVASIALGAVWGVWHVPLNVWTQAGPRLDAVALTTHLAGGGTALVTLVAYRVLIAWVYINTRGSLLLGWMTHWFLIAGLSPLAFGRMVDPPFSAVEDLQLYVAFTAILWIVVAAIVARYGANGLSNRRTTGASPVAIPSPSRA